MRDTEPVGEAQHMKPTREVYPIAPERTKYGGGWRCFTGKPEFRVQVTKAQ